MIEHFASGNWVVSRGSEEEFVQRWIEFLEWTRASLPGLRAAQLIRDAEDPRHFISFASWDSPDSMKTWRSMPEFAAKLGACSAICEDFRGSSYTVAATV